MANHHFAKIGDIWKHLPLVDPFEPFAASGELCSVELAVRLAKRGFKIVYWYGFSPAPQERGEGVSEVSARVDRNRLWVGEIALGGWQEGRRVRIVCANLSRAATQACARLGAALVEAYRDARLPDGAPGALEFTAARP